MTVNEGNSQSFYRMAENGEVRAVYSFFQSRYEFPPPLEPVKFAINDLFEYSLNIKDVLRRARILKAFVNVTSPHLNDKSWLVLFSKLQSDEAKINWFNLATIWYAAFGRVLKQAEEGKTEKARLQTYVLLTESLRMWFELPSNERAYRRWLTGLEVRTAKTERQRKIYLSRVLGLLVRAFAPSQRMAFLTSLQSATKDETRRRLYGYCIKCRKKREAIFKPITLKNRRPAGVGVCPVCGNKIFRIGKNGGEAFPTSSGLRRGTDRASRGIRKGIDSSQARAERAIDTEEPSYALEETLAEGTVTPHKVEISPEPSTRVPPKPIKRCVNLWFTSETNDDSRIPREKPLIIEETVYLRVQIAKYDSRTILMRVEEFPSTEIIHGALGAPEGAPIPLEVTLYSSDFDIPQEQRTQQMTLIEGEPTATLYFPVKPLNIGLSKLRLCVFYLNNLLQSLIITAGSVAEDGMSGDEQHAEVEMTFSADFSNTDELTTRDLWIGINQDTGETHTICIKGENMAGDTKLSRDLTEKLKTAIVKARIALLEVSFARKNLGAPDIAMILHQGYVTPDLDLFDYSDYRFDQENRPCTDGATLRDGKLAARFKEDMTKLAGAGSQLYSAVFEQNILTDEVRAKIDAMKKRITSEQVIQVTRLSNSADIWPWALMYELAIDQDSVREVCPLFNDQNGQLVPYKECREHQECRYSDLAEGKEVTVVCPYGFWGFKHIIEQPAKAGRVGNLPKAIKTSGQPVYEMLFADSLLAFASRHLNEMATKYGFAYPNCSFDSIRRLFGNPPDPHIVYFFCHGKYSNGVPLLIVGPNTRLLATVLNKWEFKWNDTHPLVFINGCHTVDLSPEKLSELMDSFVAAESSGIIGTEITVYSFLATEFAERFFELLLGIGRGVHQVGPIVKSIRLELLSKLNPLGLVYTPYCSAELHIEK